MPADYYVAPHAREALGDNAIPQVLATACAAVASASVDNAIVQSSRVYHTGADAMERLALRPVFEGEVESGRSYCLVDDVTNLGGTLAELADFSSFTAVVWWALPYWSTREGSKICIRLKRC